MPPYKIKRITAYQLYNECRNASKNKFPYWIELPINLQETFIEFAEKCNLVANEVHNTKLLIPKYGFTADLDRYKNTMRIVVLYKFKDSKAVNGLQTGLILTMLLTPELIEKLTT